MLKGTKSLLQAVARENGVNFIDEEKDDENYQSPSFIYKIYVSEIEGLLAEGALKLPAVIISQDLFFRNLYVCIYYIESNRYFSI